MKFWCSLYVAKHLKAGDVLNPNNLRVIRTSYTACCRSVTARYSGAL